jgi:phosphoketolase
MNEATWARGYGTIQHSDETRAKIASLVATLPRPATDIYTLLHAADRLASAGMWLVVHDTYARRVYLDGRPLAGDDFKTKPDGHTGGSLNMVPAYVGYRATA